MDRDLPSLIISYNNRKGKQYTGMTDNLKGFLANDTSMEKYNIVLKIISQLQFKRRPNTDISLVNKCFPIEP